MRVIRVDNGAVTYAKINDRGPFGPANRIIDLSRAAAVELDMRRAGVVDVRVEVVGKPNDITDFREKKLNPNWDGIADTFICDAIGHVAGPAADHRQGHGDGQSGCR